MLEIETLTLGPPQIIVVGEYFDRVPEFVRMVREMHDVYIYQRLRLRDSQLLSGPAPSFDFANCLIWTQLATLHLQSVKAFEIGVYISANSHLGRFTHNLEQTASAIKDPRWDTESGDYNRPKFWVVFEWEANREGLAENLAMHTIQGKGIRVIGNAETWEKREWWGVGSFGLLFGCAEGTWRWIRKLGM